MVREKAVGNFVERIQRTPTEMAGWLELRKGFHTILYENGDFVVLRDRILADQAVHARIVGAARGSKGKHEFVSEDAPGGGSHDVVHCNWRQGVTVDILRDFACLGPGVSCRLRMKEGLDVHSSQGNDWISLGCWKIRLTYEGTLADAPDPRNSIFKRFIHSEEVNAAHPGMKTHYLESVVDILHGEFFYYFATPRDETTLAVWSDLLSSSAPAGTSAVPIITPPLAKVDVRLRLGLPLLVPLEKAVDPALKEKTLPNAKSAGCDIYKATYVLNK